MAQKSRLAAGHLCVALTLLTVLGCGGGADGPDYKNFENLQLRESLAETPLGEYTVPVPVVQADDSGELVRTNLLQVKFGLHGLVKPMDEAEAARLVKRHEGQLRDRIIRVCRNSSLEDLLDPQLSTLRSRILDAAQPLFEGVTIRRILVTNVITEPL
ncbi:MAG: flagellar basal body-associated FliL family protein [Planctomycetota bacterium]